MSTSNSEPLTSKPRAYLGWLRLPNGVEMLGSWVREEDIPAPETSAWQPIETAPKDGSRILAYFDYNPIYRDSSERWFIAVVRWTGEYGMWSMPGTGGLSPKLWQPIRYPNDPPSKANDVSEVPGITPCFFCSCGFSDHRNNAKGHPWRRGPRVTAEELRLAQNGDVTPS